ncbi:MAG TPA: PRC-barrel domain-containing protein [Azospirillum sp.]|nr:PRC-barrel domain-containing protein [Azospirillum sp.]
MIQRLDVLKDFTIRATDGAIGGVADVYFDDSSWTVRYLVVDTGSWLPGRKVLLAASVLGAPVGASREFPVALTRRQVKESPDIDTDKPVSRQHEADLHGYYGWPPYWGAAAMAPGVAAPAAAVVPPFDIPAARDAPADRRESGDPHLRSGREVTGYHIQARDGAIGHVEDLLIDEAGWRIRYLLVDTRNWLPGRKVVVATDCAATVDWAQRAVSVELTREQVKGSPEYDDVAGIDRSYEEALYAHYARRPYWSL